ncbi:hypothetical protein ACFQU9_35095 [Actinomadura namibiensis]|uniref:DUF4333 domain-containing protein n=1 Tax=Actinomadura namibiensis TaxID=182080 RepID=A0A7W3LYU7_ACTNM|nr:hypothetical protein [Actinomadura namibiensis]MBA8956708.1 hypothetical protein [Actinomadura namibiensis]
MKSIPLKSVPRKPVLFGLLALAVVGVGAAVVYVTLIDVKELRHPTQAKLRGAVPKAATAELQARGVALNTGLTCQDMPGWTKEKMRVACTGKAAGNKRVQVIATGEEATRDHYYTILVDGRPVVENASCLGPDCKVKE